LTFVTAAEFVGAFPALSVTTERKSYVPSSDAGGLYAQLRLVLVPELGHTSVQVLVPAGDRWNFTLSMAASVPVVVRVIGLFTVAPDDGAVMLTLVGELVSIVKARAAEVPEFPKSSACVTVAL
jgi:hypothetical protein